jgi:hypothetical protein
MHALILGNHYDCYGDVHHHKDGSRDAAEDDGDGKEGETTSEKKSKWKIKLPDEQ